MKELALHILDIAQNSIRAEASVISIVLELNRKADTLILSVQDNGRGMDADLLQLVTDPFVTTRTTRKVGLGIPLLKQNAERTGGTLHIISKPGAGTTLKATLIPSHVDCLPLGDLAGVFALLVTSYPERNFTLTVRTDAGHFSVSTVELREALDGIALNDPAVYPAIKELIASNLEVLQITILGLKT